MKKLAAQFVFVVSIFQFGLPFGIAEEVPPDTICDIDRNKFPALSREINRNTCIVEGESVFDKWVHGLAFMWVDAPSERVFEVITDYKNWKRRVCNVDTVRIKPPLDQENYKVVEWKVLNDAGSTRYTNEYFLSPNSEPKTVTFNYIGPGQIDDMEGEWAVFQNDPDTNQVLVRYTIKLNPTIIFTEDVRRFVHKNLECLLTDLRTWGELRVPIIFGSE